MFGLLERLISLKHGNLKDMVNQEPLRYGEQLGSWTYPSRSGFYEAMMDAPLDTPFYAVVRKRNGLKPIAFIYFRNIENDVRGGRRELELISATPPIRGQTEGINFETYHDHADTQEWVSLIWGY